MFLYEAEVAKHAKPRRPRSVFDDDLRDCASEWVYALAERHEWICSVDESYLRDDFNHFGLPSLVDDYASALRLILGNYFDYDAQRRIDHQARRLYVLIHGRFVMTVPGARKMQPKFEKRVFGVCPRVACRGQALLPIGLNPRPGEATVKAFCPSCQDVYDPHLDLDGAFFGPGFPHFFVQALHEDVAVEPFAPTQLAVFGVPVAATRAVH
jgi:casein kinase II subunit beta